MQSRMSIYRRYVEHRENSKNKSDGPGREHREEQYRQRVLKYVEIGKRKYSEKGKARRAHKGGLCPPGLFRGFIVQASGHFRVRPGL